MTLERMSNLLDFGEHIYHPYRMKTWRIWAVRLIAMWQIVL